MNTQPEALRLAAELEDAGKPTDITDAAAAELRRLYAVNQDLLEALKAYGSHTGNCDYLMLLTSMPPQRKPCSCGLHAAVAKHGSKT